MIGLCQWSILVVAALVAAVIDIRKGLIPNYLTAPLFFSGLIWSAFKGGFLGVGDALAACLVLALPYVLLFLFAGGGAGDAKMMGAIGTWVGLSEGVIVLLFVSVAALFLALLTSIYKKQLKNIFIKIFVDIHSFFVYLLSGRIKEFFRKQKPSEQHDKLTMPYGLAIFIGVCSSGVYFLI
ncbi:MAG: prepilin peptidase [Planctomycetota bacterium]|jgi:Flp pilus assembly protein protease CpaA